MRIDYGQTDVLYFFHTDHLGSTSLLSDEDGYYVDDTEARYLPFGGYRVEPTADLTDHGFIGHKQNAYMNAAQVSQSREMGIILAESLEIVVVRLTRGGSIEQYES